MTVITRARCVVCRREVDTAASWDCPVCGNNLEIVYDPARVADGLAAERLRGVGERSILRYLPLLPVQDPAMYPALSVGWTPLLQVERLRSRLGLSRLFVKDDTRNPSASFKDRASAVALAHARAIGAEVVCAASTGNAGSSMACLAASVGQRCVIFVPKAAPEAKVAQLMTFGATVLAVDGTYDDAFDLSLEASRRWGWYNRNTGTNPYTREGKKTVSLELWEQLGFRVPDHVLVPVGDGNIISGVHKGFRDLMDAGLIDRLPRIHGIQSDRSDAVVRTIEVLGGSTDLTRAEVQHVSATTRADSISVDLPRDGLAAVRAILETSGEAVRVTDRAIMEAIPTLARTTGVFPEPAGATSLAGLEALLERGGVIGPDDTVVILVTGNGLKDVAAALDVAGEPPVIEPTLAAAERILGRN